MAAKKKAGAKKKASKKKVAAVPMDLVREALDILEDNQFIDPFARRDAREKLREFFNP